MTWAAGNFRGGGCNNLQECITGPFGTFSLFGDSLGGQGLEKETRMGFSG